MKKILYSVFLSSAVLFAACSQEDKGTSTEVVNNDEEKVNPNNINDYDQVGTAGSRGSTAYTDASYQQHAQYVTDEMTRDLQLDDLTAVEIVKIYYKRNEQLGRDVSASEATNGDGQSGANRTNIDNMTDQEMKAVLTPEQYKKYQQNRDRYNNMRMNNGTPGGTTTGTGTNTSADRPTQRDQQ